MNYRNSRRAPKRRITGRFYAFMTILVMIVVLIGVLIGLRSKRPAQQQTPPPTDPNAQVVQYQQEQPAQQQEDVVPAQQTEQTPESVEQANVDAEPAEPQTQIGDGIEVGTAPQSDAELTGKISVNPELPSEWTNILLLGSDTRDMAQLEHTRCDTIIIVSVNTQTGQLKMTSLMRDMMIELPGKGEVKMTAVPASVSVEGMMRLLNEKLGMNIANYALVNFEGMVRIVDILGGVKVSLSKAEAQEINNQIGDVSQYTMTKEEYKKMKPEVEIKTWGEGVVLNGVQAVSYARIRSLDNDFERTRRQKRVLTAMMDGVKGADIGKLSQIGIEVLKHMKTNINMMNAVGWARAVLSCNLESKERVKDWQIPKIGETAVYEKRNGTEAFFDVDYPELRRRIHLFIYGQQFPGDA